MSQYSNPIIDALDAGLAANLSKSQWQLYAFILRQTVGFNKSIDDLSASRISDLTKLRRDHAKSTLIALEKKGLITTKKGKYGQQITLLSGNDAPNIRETLPETRAELPKTRLNNSNQLPNFRGTLPNFRGELPNIGVKFTQLSGTYNTNHNITKHTTPNNVHPPVPETNPDTGNDQNVGERVCRVFDGLLKALDEDTQQTALNFTQVLGQAKQQTTLKVWVAMINQGMVKTSPLALLNALVKAAKANTLNTSILQTQPAASDATNALTPEANTEKAAALAKAQDEHSKRVMVEQHAKLLGLSVEEYLQRFTSASVNKEVAA